MAYEDEKKKINDYYTQLKEENYRTLLDSQIQLDNARQRAAKQMNVGLASGGMNTSGYASQAQNNLENQYLTGLQQNQQTFNQQNANYNTSQQNALTDLALKEEERLNTERDTNVGKVVDIITKGDFSKEEDIYDVLSGFGHFDGSTWVSDIDMTPENEAYINALIKNAKLGLGTTTDENGNAVLSTEDTEWLKQNGVTDMNGVSSYDDLKKTNWKTDESRSMAVVDDEAEILFDTLPNKIKPENGDVFRLEEWGGGQHSAVYLVYYNGKYYKTDEQTWNKASNRMYINYNEGNEPGSGSKGLTLSNNWTLTGRYRDYVKNALTELYSRTLSGYSAEQIEQLVNSVLDGKENVGSIKITL